MNANPSSVREQPAGINRRDFLQTTARSAAVLGAAPFIASNRVLGANNTLGTIPNTTLLHWKNFLHCVRTREKPVSDVEFGFHVQVAMNMAMLAFLNRKVATYDTAKQEIVL